MALEFYAIVHNTLTSLALRAKEIDGNGSSQGEGVSF